MIGAYSASRCACCATVGASIDRLRRAPAVRTALSRRIRHRGTAAARAAGTWSPRCCARAGSRGAIAGAWRASLRALSASRWQVRPDRDARGLARAARTGRRRDRDACGGRCASPRSTRRSPRRSAQVFANVLRDSLGADSAASDAAGCPAATCRRCCPRPSSASCRARGGAVRRGARGATRSARPRPAFASNAGLGALRRRRLRRAAGPAAAASASAFAPALVGRARRDRATSPTSRSAPST